MHNILDFFQGRLIYRIKKIKKAKSKDKLIQEVMSLREHKRAELVYKHISKEEKE